MNKKVVDKETLYDHLVEINKQMKFHEDLYVEERITYIEYAMIDILEYLSKLENKE